MQINAELFVFRPSTTVKIRITLCMSSISCMIIIPMIIIYLLITIIINILVSQTIEDKHHTLTSVRFGSEAAPPGGGSRLLIFDLS